MRCVLTEGITDKHLSEVYQDPYIQRIGHDNRHASPVNHPAVTYLSAWSNGLFAGAFMAVRNSPCEIEVHALLRQHAIGDSRCLGSIFIDWAFSNEKVLRVTANVMQGFETVKNFCIKLGFSHEGTRRAACVRGGVVTDVYMLGITREDWSK